MSTVGQVDVNPEPRRGSVGGILRDNGLLLVAELVLVSALTFVAYGVFDFDLIWVVVIPLIAAAIGLGGAVVGADRLNSWLR